MSEQLGARSLSRAVFADVRAGILSGAYAPGSKLSPKAIATAANVSLSVVREALTRLAEQGLVVAEPQLGFSVVTLDLEGAQDLNRVRVLIEGAAVKDAIDHADVEYETRVIASHHRLSRTPQWADEQSQTVTEDWARAHAQFHAALLSACTSPRLVEMAASLRETAELYRRWSSTFNASRLRRDVAGEHQALMQAALDRDADLCSRLAGEHINKTTELLTYAVELHEAETDGPTAVSGGA
ncbi:MAG TPA: GntR family transcriptional regulator [Nocardioides sp.]|nr:GntR family transcriptional regulator [Nocardioides sp.]